jgi:hypothetical protein
VPAASPLALDKAIMKNKKSTNMPYTPSDWLSELSEAYFDAYESIPFGILVGQKISEKELFHMAPQICLKMRGIERSKANVDKATEAMLTSYLATQDQIEGIFNNPHIAFGFAYLASHYGIGLLLEEDVSEIMAFLEGHQIELNKLISKKINKKV